MPAKIDEILDISKKFDIPVIEDAAEALGSTYKKKILEPLENLEYFLLMVIR